MIIDVDRITFIFIIISSIISGNCIALWILMRMLEKSNQADDIDDTFYHNTKRPMRIRTSTLVYELKDIIENLNS